MDILKAREEMRMGRSIFDLPLRVTFYARVSTDKDEQLNSLENQVQYYTELIREKPNWVYVPGYIDEGLSGLTAQKRESFLRMIEDAKAGRFDLILTKEISRFSRSTLDSITYTQQLLERGVGVFFQNDGINTLEPDSEFRLVVMSGIAQDEMRKLSERLKFGYRQSIKNGHVLGNDKLYGYDKKDCKLTVKEDEAAIVRRVFHLYANEGLGARRISQQLWEEDIKSREGNPFNQATIRHMLQNPKYKGWYCGNKSRSVDYRTKKKAFLDENEWVTYPDPNIPAIVSEELWDRANALFRQRSGQAKAHQKGAGYHNRYSYSGKILCEEHGEFYHHRLLKSDSGEKEVWRCRVYRERGRKGCSSPPLYTAELDQLMARVFNELVESKQALIDATIKVIEAVRESHDFEKDFRKLDQEQTELRAKKDRLLELNIAGTVSDGEFKERNDGFNALLAELAQRREVLESEAEKSQESAERMEEIKLVLEETLSFQNGVDTRLVTTLLDHIVVGRDSTDSDLRLTVYLKVPGEAREARILRDKSGIRELSFLDNRSLWSAPPAPSLQARKD